MQPSEILNSHFNIVHFLSALFQFFFSVCIQNAQAVPSSPSTIIQLIQQADTTPFPNDK